MTGGCCLFSCSVASDGGVQGAVRGMSSRLTAQTVLTRQGTNIHNCNMVSKDMKANAGISGYWSFVKIKDRSIKVFENTLNPYD